MSKKLEDLMTNFTSSMAEGGQPAVLPKAEACVYLSDLPEAVFPEEVGITIRELSNAQELKAAKRAKNDAMSMAYELAKSAMVEFDGEPIKAKQRAWLWEAIGVNGRNQLMVAYSKLTNPMADGDDEDFSGNV